MPNLLNSEWINQRVATLLLNDLFYPLVSSTCFGLSPVHHQEHHLINCITHRYVRAGESSYCVDVHLAVAWMYIHTTARLVGVRPSNS